MIEIFAELCRVELLLFLIRISYTDLRYQKIRNREIYFQLIFEIFSIIILEKANIIQLVGRSLLPVVILIIPYLNKGIGAGDIKTYILVSNLMKSKVFLTVFWVSLLLGAFEYILIKFVEESEFKKKQLANFKEKIVHENKKKKIICMGPCISISVILWIFGIIK